MVSVAGMPLKYLTIDVETREGDTEVMSDSERPPTLPFLGCTACSMSQLLSPLAHNMSADSLLTNRFTTAYVTQIIYTLSVKYIRKLHSNQTLVYMLQR